MKITKAALVKLIKEELRELTEAPAAPGDPAANPFKGFGSTTATQSTQARGSLERAKAIAKGDTLGGVDNKERAMLLQIEKALTSIAEKDNLVKYRTVLQNVLQKLLASAEKAVDADKDVKE